MERGDPGVGTAPWGCGMSTGCGVGSPGFSLALSSWARLASHSSKPRFLIWNTRGMLTMLHANALFCDAGWSSERVLGNKRAMVCFPCCVGHWHWGNQVDVFPRQRLLFFGDTGWSPILWSLQTWGAGGGGREAGRWLTVRGTPENLVSIERSQARV